MARPWRIETAACRKIFAEGTVPRATRRPFLAGDCRACLLVASRGLAVVGGYGGGGTSVHRGGAVEQPHTAAAAFPTASSSQGRTPASPSRWSPPSRYSPPATAVATAVAPPSCASGTGYPEAAVAADMSSPSTSGATGGNNHLAVWMAGTERELRELKWLLGASTARLDGQHNRLMGEFGKLRSQLDSWTGGSNSWAIADEGRLQVLEARFDALEQLVGREQSECAQMWQLVEVAANAGASSAARGGGGAAVPVHADLPPTRSLVPGTSASPVGTVGAVHQPVPG